MSWSELDEHRRYWHDQVKIDRYRQALRATVDSSSVVLDLGCGTGLLGLLALEAGAKRVYAVDHGSIVGVAGELAAANGFAERHVAIRAKSTDVELPELVDVVVGDQIGGFVFDAGVLEYYEDAAKRLLKPGGVMIPSGFELRLGLVDDGSSAEFLGFWATRPAGFDLSSLSALAANVSAPLRLRADQFLGPTVASLRLASHDARPFRLEAWLPVTRAGTLHGVAGMFEATMAPNVLMTNDPTLTETTLDRWQNLYPLSTAVEVAVGDAVGATFNVRPRSDHVEWSVRVERAGATIVHERHSSFLGRFLCADDLGPLRPPARDGRP